MKIRSSPEPEGDIINMTPVIDMMFILVIFFALNSQYREEERDIQVNLPANAQGASLSSAPKVLVLNVRKDGTYVIGNQQVTLDEVGEKIRKSLKEDPDQKVLIRADDQALHGYVAQAVAACRFVGVKEANIGYKLPD
ncbi:MAG: biopolymer transporter ExbD [bacterium]